MKTLTHFVVATTGLLKKPKLVTTKLIIAKPYSRLHLPVLTIIQALFSRACINSANFRFIPLIHTTIVLNLVFQYGHIYNGKPRPVLVPMGLVPWFKLLTRYSAPDNNSNMSFQQHRFYPVRSCQDLGIFK